MKYVRAIISSAFLLFTPFCMGQDGMRDAAIGMQGLQEVLNNPALLAQLMEDMKVRCHREDFL